MAMPQFSDDHSNDIIIHLLPELRRRIKKAAAQSNLSEQDYIGHILEQVVPFEESVVDKRSGRLNKAAVEELLRFREELRLAHPGEVFEDSAELVRKAREERMRELEER
jgi:predicted metal-dependent RNase